MFTSKKLIRAQSDYIKQLEKSINDKNEITKHMKELIKAYEDSFEMKNLLIENQKEIIGLLKNMRRV